MKRWPLRILLCLILLTGGAVTTVAVAWGCSFTFWTQTPRALELDESEARRLCGELIYPNVDLHLVPHYGVREEFVGLTIVRAGAVTNLTPTYDVEVRRAGWPSRALYAYEAGLLTRENSLEINVGLWLIEWNPMHNEVWMPVRPIWPGFVIDTLFYASIWYGVFFGFGSAKRAIRRKRGRCPRCGYDLRGALEKGCSECGWNRAGNEFDYAG